MADIDYAEIRALYGDSDYVTISVYGLEMLVADHEALRARLAEVEAERDALGEELAQTDRREQQQRVRAEAAEAEAFEHCEARRELNDRCTDYRLRAEAAEARLSEVEAERDAQGKIGEGLATRLMAVTAERNAAWLDLDNTKNHLEIAEARAEAAEARLAAVEKVAAALRVMGASPPAAEWQVGMGRAYMACAADIERALRGEGDRD